MTTKAVVHFLPWARREEFPSWIAGAGVAAHVQPRDFTAVKIHFGEEGNVGYIRPPFVRPVVEALLARDARPFLTDANTIYVGSRADAYHHLRTAAAHGFTQEQCGCPVIIADGLRGNSSVEVPVGLEHCRTVHIANAIHYADSFVFMNHFKGHEISGFGGALKNIGMGCGSRAGKYAMHDSLRPAVDQGSCVGCGVCIRWCSAKALSLKGGRIVLDTQRCVGCGECILSCPHEVFSIPWDDSASAVQAKIVEYAYGVLRGKKHFSVNFLNHMTKYCDCYPSKGGPLLDDIGILASTDPVALDQASIELVNARFGGDFARHIFPDIDWTVQLSYAERLGLGTRSYTLKDG